MKLHPKKISGKIIGCAVVVLMNGHGIFALANTASKLKRQPDIEAQLQLPEKNVKVARGGGGGGHGGGHYSGGRGGRSFSGGRSSGRSFGGSRGSSRGFSSSRSSSRSRSISRGSGTHSMSRSRGTSKGRSVSKRTSSRSVSKSSSGRHVAKRGGHGGRGGGDGRGGGGHGGHGHGGHHGHHGYHGNYYHHGYWGPGYWWGFGWGPGWYGYWYPGYYAWGFPDYWAWYFAGFGLSVFYAGLWAYETRPYVVVVRDTPSYYAIYQQDTDGYEMVSEEPVTLDAGKRQIEINDRNKDIIIISNNKTELRNNIKTDESKNIKKYSVIDPSKAEKPKDKVEPLTDERINEFQTTIKEKHGELEKAQQEKEQKESVEDTTSEETN
jgi:hypothetical protein